MTDTASQGSPSAPYLDFVFAPVHGTPDLIFVEVEDEAGRSVNVGEWVDDGRYHRLRVRLPRVQVDRGPCLCDDDDSDPMRLPAADPACPYHGVERSESSSKESA